MINYRDSIGLRAAVAVIFLAFGVSGCAYSMGDFSRSGMQKSAVATEAATPELPPDAPVPVDQALATVDPSAGVAVAEEPKNKLLTPEERERVIAELEALAAKQGAPVAEARKAANDECAALAAQALDPEERLKREKAGLTC